MAKSSDSSNARICAQCIRRVIKVERIAARNEVSLIARFQFSGEQKKMMINTKSMTQTNGKRKISKGTAKA